MQARHIYSTLFSSKKLILHISFVVNWQQKNWQKNFDTKHIANKFNPIMFRIIRTRLKFPDLVRRSTPGSGRARHPCSVHLVDYINSCICKFEGGQVQFLSQNLGRRFPLLTCDQKTGVTGLEWWPVSFGAQICQELSTACEGSGRRRASNCQSFDDSPSPCLRSAKTYRCQLDSSWLKSRWSLSCNGRHWSVCCELGDFWFCCHICILYL